MVDAVVDVEDAARTEMEHSAKAWEDIVVVVPGNTSARSAVIETWVRHTFDSDRDQRVRLRKRENSTEVYGMRLGDRVATYGQLP